MASTSQITIDFDAIMHNVEFTQNLIGNETKLSAVIKGNAYGHGTSYMVCAFEQAGINHFSVFSSPEAKDAYAAISPGSSIMIMGYICDADYDWVIENGVEFYISNFETLIKAIKTSKQLNKRAKVHLDLETGMNRTGISYKNFKKAIPVLKENQEFIEIVGTASHFAGAESIANHTRIRKQFSVFKRRIKTLKQHGIEPGIQHIASSAATINYPDTHMDMVRVGILLYGYWPTRETFIHYIHRRKDKTDPIRRAMSWKSKVKMVKKVPEGEFIGYGMSFQAQHDMRIMIVPVGYANGYSRSLSNNGRLLVRDYIVPVIGSVNMNMIICDITHAPEVQKGDQVVLIGQIHNNEISFSSFADMNNSLNYEILARLPENIQRNIVNIPI
jgi:alanine racemase